MITYERRQDMDFRDHNALPEGLGFSLALDVEAMTNFVNLTDATKEEVVRFIQMSDTGEEAKERTKLVVHRLHRNESVENIMSLDRFS